VSLCSDFTESYLQHTKNLSYPIQTALEQWLVTFNGVTSSTLDLSVTMNACTTRIYDQAKGTYTKTIPAGCGVAVEEFNYDFCTAFASIYVENFALTTTLAPVCGLTTDAVLVATSQPRDDNPTIVPTTSLLITDTRGVDPDDTIVPVTPPETTGGVPSSAPIVTNTPDLPTITIANEATPAPVGTESTLPTVTLPADPVATASGGSNNPDSPLAATITNPPALPVQTIVTYVEAVVPTIATYVIEDSAGSIHTIVTEVDPLAPVEATYLVTNSLGQVQPVVTSLDAAAPLQATYTITDSSGSVQTVVAAINAISGSTSVFTTVNDLGQTETLVAIVGTPAASSLTYLVTKSDGTVETVVTAYNAPGVSQSVYFSTNADGSVETIIVPLQELAEPLTTYITTMDGNVVTVVATLGATTTSSAPRYTTTTQYTSLITTTGTDGKVTSFSAVVVQTIIVTTSPVPETLNPTASSATAKSSATRPPQPSFVLSSSEKVVDGTFTKASYFLSMYLAPLVAVIIKAMWEIVFAAIKLTQPFERMATAVGTDAQYSLFAQYLSSSLSFDMFNSIGHGNLLPLWSAVMYLIVQVGAPLSAASMTVKSRDICIINGKERRCDPVWVVNVSMLRGLEGALIVCLVLVLLVLWSTRRSRSGISSDPSSFASLALLMNHGPLIDSIQTMSPDADHSAYEAALEGHRFRLGYHIVAADQRVYGIISSQSAKVSELDNESTAYMSNTNRAGTPYSYQAIHNPATSTPVSSYTRTSFLSRTRHNVVMDVLGLLFPLTLLTLILTFYVDDNLDDIYNTFFNSNTIAPKLVLVGLASLSSLHLSHLERSVRVTEPFRRLAANAPHAQPSFFSFARRKEYKDASRTSVPPETTILISRSGTYYSNIPQCLSLLAMHELHGGRMIFQTLMSLTAILADLNIIAVAGIPYNDSMTIEVYKGSCIASLIITTWIVLMYGVTLVWWRRNKVVQVVGGKSISKGVATIGGMMRWLCGGGSEVVEAIGRVREETEMLRGRGRRFGGEIGRSETIVWFGRTGFVGADGRERWSLSFDREGETRGLKERKRSTQSLGQWF